MTGDGGATVRADGVNPAGRAEEIAVQALELTKRFGHFTAVDTVSFSVPRGTIFGLLGANGAGKSTIIRMLCGLLRSTSGTATVAGFDINRESEQIKRTIGYMSQRFSLYLDLTVRQNIRFFGGIYGLSPQQLAEGLEEVLEMAGLRDRVDTLTGELSGGWRQRLALGCAILHRPRIVFLDEPTAGVDPVSRRDFWELINELAAGGTTVLVTTHYLDEAEYANRILLVHAGRIVASGAPGELKGSLGGGPTLEVSCSRCIQALERLQAQPWVQESALFGSAVHVQPLPGLELEEMPIFELRSVKPILPSLEDVFIRLIERRSLEPNGGRQP
jgi:ABC-2 type transport system ATP-binding protein